MANITSITLSSGNVTSSGTFSTLDNTFGSAGTANVNVMSVQGIASGIAQPISGSVSISGTPTVGVSGTIPVSGTFFQTTQPVSISGISITSSSINVNVSNANANGQTTMANGAPVSIASNQSTLAIAYDTTQIFDGGTGTSATPTKTKISVASATTTTIVSGTSGKKIRVLAQYIVAGGANNLNWQSHSTTTNSDGVQDFAANGGIVLPFNPVGWFDTTSGEALDLVTSASTQVGGLVVTAAV